MSQRSYKCKRCSRSIAITDKAWNEITADGADALAGTLPQARDKQLQDMLRSYSSPSAIADVSRLLSQSFRSDRITRSANGAIKPNSSALPTQLQQPSKHGMDGPLALIIGNTSTAAAGSKTSTSQDSPQAPGDAKALDRAQQPKDAKADGSASNIGPPLSPVVSDPGSVGSVDRHAAGSNTSQSESFILLSSSQLLQNNPAMSDTNATALQQLVSKQLSNGQKSAISDADNFHSFASQSVAEIGDSALSNAGSTSSAKAAIAATAAAASNTAHKDGIADGMAVTFDVIGRITDKLEERSAIDHPMCEECAETMLRVLDREMADCAHEVEILDGIAKTAQAAAAASKASSIPIAEDVKELERELDRQTELERTLEETLGTLDAQLEDISSQIASLDEENKQLDMLESQNYQELNNYQQILERCEAEQWALDEKYTRLAAQLTQLQRTNVYNDVFNITVHDGIASINGFRLGGRSSLYAVEWAEINAAWGQALLLLQTVARKLNYEFLGYKLIPMGSFSRIEKTMDGSATYELFGSGDLYLGRLFQNRRFDSAMVAYLACLDQLAQLVMSLNRQIRLPYRIEQDKVGGASIKLQFGQDDAWTRACKNTLMNARWILAFASSYASSAPDDI